MEVVVPARCLLSQARSKSGGASVRSAPGTIQELYVGVGIIVENVIMQHNGSECCRAMKVATARYTNHNRQVSRHGASRKPLPVVQGISGDVH